MNLILYPNRNNSGRGKVIDYSIYTHKVCSKCAKIKEVAEFIKERRIGGIGWRYRSQCKICRRPYNKEYERKRRRERGIKEKKIMPKEQMIEHQRQASRKHYYSHLEQERERSKDWKQNNKEKQRFFEKRRKARKKNGNGNHTIKEWANLKLSYGNLCVFCQKSEPEIKLTEDHIIPLSKGGTDYIGNIQPLCFSCNASKQDKVIDRLETCLLRFDNV